MGLAVKVEPIERDVELLIDETLSPEAQSAFLANVARQSRDEAIAINTQALGHAPDYDTWVDGRETDDLDSVKPLGRIIFLFELVQELFAWIGAELVQHSPVVSGRYARGHLFFADGDLVDPGGAVPEAHEYAFVNEVPYARKIERGESAMAPDGVYQAVAAIAQARFGNLARIRFSYRTLTGAKADRQPAIIITMR
jgi:hypothetical protein